MGVRFYCLVWLISQTSMICGNLRRFLMDRFTELGAEVNFYDPHVPEIGKTREHMEWAGKKSLEWSEEHLRNQDVIVIATDHAAVDYKALIEHSDLIVDTRNALGGLTFKEGQVSRA